MSVPAMEEIKTGLSGSVEETVLGGAIRWDFIEGKGRGVFAARDIRKGEMIERAPVVPMDKDHIPEGSPPDGYVLDWRLDEPGEEHAICLGYIMLYNHSASPNVHMDSDFEMDRIEVSALRDIREGEELTWDYNCEIWFDLAD